MAHKEQPPVEPEETEHFEFEDFEEDEEEPKVEEFMEIGGSPVAGFTLRQVLQDQKDHIYRIAWSPHGNSIAVPLSNGRIKIYDNSSKITKTLKGHTKWVCSVEWSPYENVLASGSQDKTI